MVKGLIGFSLGILLMVSCASLPAFPFKYYSLDAENYAGNLRGPSEAQDVDLKKCMPNAQDAAPCMVMFTSSFIKMRDEYLKMKVDLKACEKQQ